MTPAELDYGILRFGDSIEYFEQLTQAVLRCAGVAPTHTTGSSLRGQRHRIFSIYDTGLQSAFEAATRGPSSLPCRWEKRLWSGS